MTFQELQKSSAYVFGFVNDIFLELLNNEMKFQEEFDNERHSLWYFSDFSGPKTVYALN